MTSQSVGVNQWGLAAVGGNWPGTNGTWPSSYDYTATGAGVPVYIPERFAPLEPSWSMIHDPWGGTLNIDHGTLMASLVGSDTHGVAKDALVFGAASTDGNGNGSIADMQAALDAILAHKQANFPTAKAVCAVSRLVFGEGVSNSLGSRIAALKNAGVYVLAATGHAAPGGQGIDDLAASSFNSWPAEDPNATPVTGCSLDGGRHPLYHCINRGDQIIAPALDNEYLNHLNQPTMGWGTSLAPAFAAGALACYIEAGYADPLQTMLDARVYGRAFGFPADTGVLYKDPAMAGQQPPPPPPPPTGTMRCSIGLQASIFNQNHTTFKAVPFNKVNHDVGGWFDPLLPGFRVPAGVTHVRVGRQLVLTGIPDRARVFHYVDFATTGPDFLKAQEEIYMGNAGSYRKASGASRRIAVNEGDTFKVDLLCSTPGIGIDAHSEFWIEATSGTLSE